MSDDKAPDETTADQEPQDAGPVAAEAPEEPTNGAPETDGAPEVEAAADEPAAESDEGSEAVEEAPAEEPQAEEPEAEEPQAEKKKDVIPGADLEPIAVEPEKQLSAEEKARLEAEEEEKANREAALAGADDSEAEAASRAPAKM
ncbi:MAG TPA: hypothetical protein VIH47_03715, partial [Solirubrobacterales bacterium]